MADAKPEWLIDTTVLVDLLRGSPEAAEFLARTPGRMAVSALTVAELFAGARASDELPLSRLLTLFDVLPVSSRTAQVGGVYRRLHGPRSGTSLVDALIAATAQVYGCRLVTHNRRHFPMLDDLLVPY